MQLRPATAVQADIRIVRHSAIGAASRCFGGPGRLWGMAGGSRGVCLRKSRRAARDVLPALFLGAEVAVTLRSRAVADRCGRRCHRRELVPIE